MQSRPNKNCLICNSACKPPTAQRAFYTCSKDCAEAANTGISPFMKKYLENPSEKIRNAKNIMEIACAYHVLKNSPVPLGGMEIMEMMRSQFGSKHKFKTNHFKDLFHYFESNILKSKGKRGVVYSVIDPIIPFQRVLKSKYQDYVFGGMKNE